MISVANLYSTTLRHLTEAMRRRSNGMVFQALWDKRDKREVEFVLQVVVQLIPANRGTHCIDSLEFCPYLLQIAVSLTRSSFSLTVVCWNLSGWLSRSQGHPILLPKQPVTLASQRLLPLLRKRFQGPFSWIVVSLCWLGAPPIRSLCLEVAVTLRYKEPGFWLHSSVVGCCVTGCDGWL